MIADAGESGVPQSPETQPPAVRDQLDQDLISHDGPARDGEDVDAGSSSGFGAVEDEVTPIMPPVSGPSDLVSDEDAKADVVDPADEITPG